MSRKPNPTQELWSISHEYLQQITQEEAEFILGHGEKTLADTLETNKIITDKASGFLSLAIGIFAAVVGYSIDRWDKSGKWDNMLIATSIGAIYLLVVAIVFSINIYPTNYYVLGARPEVFFNSNFFNKKIKDDDRKLFLYVNEIEDCQLRIVHNRKINDWRWYWFRIAYRALIASPIIFVVIYLLLSSFRPCHL
ncbi:MAG: hypothetical protein QM629_00900 [Parafilimonas sp.]